MGYSHPTFFIYLFIFASWIFPICYVHTKLCFDHYVIMKMQMYRKKLKIITVWIENNILVIIGRKYKTQLIDFKQIWWKSKIIIPWWQLWTQSIFIWQIKCKMKLHFVIRKTYFLKIYFYYFLKTYNWNSTGLN